MTGWLGVVSQAAEWVLAVIGGITVLRWLRRPARLEAERDEAMSIANQASWREFVQAHPLDDPCPDCSLWDAEGDRPVPKPCDKHEEGAQ